MNFYTTPERIKEIVEASGDDGEIVLATIIALSLPDDMFEKMIAADNSNDVMDIIVPQTQIIAEYLGFMR